MRITWYCLWLNHCKQTVELFEKANSCVQIWGFQCFLVFSLSCGIVAGSQLVMECTLRSVGRTQADPCLPQWSLQGMLSWNPYSASLGEPLVSLYVHIRQLLLCGFSRRLCMLACWSQSKPHSLSELSSSGVSTKDLCDPRVGKDCGSWSLEEGSFTSVSSWLGDCFVVICESSCPSFHFNCRCHCGFSHLSNRAPLLAYCTTGFSSRCLCL